MVKTNYYYSALKTIQTAHTINEKKEKTYCCEFVNSTNEHYATTERA